ncbi:MAG: HDIG domain-containing protein [Candidatus Thermoplasmatota archaeon]|nr:HDIG domain-containing protein [Candidatus Thermoplasmatota archaeon]
MLSRDKARELLQAHVETVNLRKHMLAVAAIMEALAGELDCDPDVWWLTGLLHDVDYEETRDRPELHGTRSAEILQGLLPGHALRAIRAHNWRHTGIEPSSPLDHGLIASDALSGLVVATALVMPHASLDEVRVSSVLKKMDDGSFAKNIDRGRIRQCTMLNLGVQEYVSVALPALQRVHEELGL